MPPDLKEQATSRALSKGISLGCYICDAVRAELTGNPVRRRRSPLDDVRQDLAKLHAAIIRAGNQLADQHHVAENSEPIGALKDAATSLLQLERAIRLK